jgi:hypothetical protein
LGLWRVRQSDSAIATMRAHTIDAPAIIPIVTKVKSRLRGLADPVRIFTRYTDAGLEYYSLKVVGRGLFLIIMLMIAFLFVFTFVTDLIVGVNEVTVPTVDVDPGIDLGGLVSSAFSRVSGAVVSTSGVLVLIASALLTAHALRQGSHRALSRDDNSQIKLFQMRTLGGAAAISSLIMITWLMTLATAIRQKAWMEILTGDIPEWIVDAAKAIGIAGVMVIVAISIAFYIHSITDTRTTTKQFGVALLISGVLVGASFALLYTYVGALINPRVSTGVILVFSLLLWVNVVVRSYFFGLCWVAALKHDVRTTVTTTNG